MNSAEKAIIEDARRYRRLRILGCHVYSLQPGVESATRFQNLDTLVDRDIKAFPSRGEFVEDLPALPPPPAVPLGDNVTRDGRKVRVICTDVHGTRRKVRYLVTREGKEIVRSCDSFGRHNIDGSPSKNDLVGHLPPEPKGLTEFWAKIDTKYPAQAILVMRDKPQDAASRGYRFFREVTP